MPTQKPNFNIDFNGGGTTTLPTLPTLPSSSSHPIPQITIPITTQFVPPKPREYSITFRSSPSRDSLSGLSGSVGVGRTMSRSNSGLPSVVTGTESSMSKGLIQGFTDFNLDVPLSYLPVFYSLYRDIEDEREPNGERLTDNLNDGVINDQRSRKRDDEYRVSNSEIHQSMRQDVGFSNESKDSQILEPGLKDFIQQLQSHSSTLGTSNSRSSDNNTITNSKITQRYSGSQQPTNDDIFEYQLLCAWNSDSKIKDHGTSVSSSESETPLYTKPKQIESISQSHVAEFEERRNSLSGRHWRTVAIERIKLVVGHFR